LNIDAIRNLSRDGKLRWTDHLIERIVKRNISREDIKSVLMNGEIIEQYPDDYPYPSCLILGQANGEGKLHVVCGMGDDEVWMITAYYPDLQEWNDDLMIRREHKL